MNAPFLDGDFMNARAFKSCLLPVFGTMHFGEEELMEFFSSAVQITFYKESENNYLVRDTSGVSVAA